MFVYVDACVCVDVLVMCSCGFLVEGSTSVRRQNTCIKKFPKGREFLSKKASLAYGGKSPNQLKPAAQHAQNFPKICLPN